MKRGIELLIGLAIILLFFQYSIEAKTVTGDSTISGKASTQPFQLGIPISGAPSLVIVQPYNETYLKNYSLPLSFIHYGADNFWYDIDSGSNISISNNLTFGTTEGLHLLSLYANNSDGVTHRTVLFTVNLTKLQIIYSNYQGAFKGNSTDFLSYTYERIHNISVSLENTNYGKMEFYPLINMTSMTIANFDNETNLSYARLYFNSADLPAFINKSAEISFYGITLSNPAILRNNFECPASLCSFISYSGGNFVFNITGLNESDLFSISPKIFFAEPTEASGTTVTRDNIIVNATSPIYNFKNISVYLYDSFSLIDVRHSDNYTLYANFSGLANGIYFFNATSYDLSENPSFTETRNVTVNTTYLLNWKEIISPEGVFEPENPSLAGTHVHTFSVKFVQLSISPSDSISCLIKLSNDSLMKVSATGLNLVNANYSLNYTIASSDSMINDPSAGYLPWILKNCTMHSSINTTQNITSRIYVHSPVYWDDSEVTRAVACEGTPGVYFNNTAKCAFSQDTLFALQMRNGNPVVESCFNNQGGCSHDYCKALFFPTCDSLSYFGGMSALTDDPNGYTTFAASFAGYNTVVAYTKYTNTSGTFKLRINQALSGKTFSITVYNFTNVSGANVYGSDSGSGKISLTNNGDGTFNVALNRLNSSYTGTLDFVFNISFNDVQNQNRTLKLVLAYGTDTNQGTPATFPAEFSSIYGLHNSNEAESTSITAELNGVCGDNVNNDFDYLSGWANSYDCFDPECNLVFGATQTNEFGSGKTGLCNYQKELNCTDTYDNDYDTILATDYTDCHDADCFQNVSAGCPIKEAVCNDNINNDWDYTNTESDIADKIGNNGSKYGIAGTSPLTDCEDIDCNNSAGAGGMCNWGYETDCSDGFNNDALQLKDCELSVLSGTTSMPSVANAEYDCSSFCRITTSAEIGALCNNNKDDDYDAVIVTGYYTGTSNSSYGAGIDCRWGGYFGIGSNYNPDEDCNFTILSSGNRCELAKEITCNDSFDNDFDYDAAGMPHAGWSANIAGYQAYFNQTFVNYADYDDYDCKSNTLTPTTESLNASWCFDGIDNDLDKYYFNGANYVLNSSGGIDCADPDCSGITNPANPSQGCFAAEYNASDALFNDSARCSDSLDNDLNSQIDCSDLSCFKKFDACSVGQCKTEENSSWNSCSDGLNNDYFDGTDCADSNCIGMIGESTGALCKITEACNDNFDNNANSQTDCSEHAACDNQIGGRINSNDVYCRASESTSSDCSDNFDNDADGKIDCYDESCNAACNLSTISGTNPVSLPVIASLSLNSVSDAFVSSYTKQARNTENYVVTMTMTTESTNAQWTLGTASKPFSKAAFNTSTADLTGTDAGSFTLTETANGFVLNSNHAHFPTGYTFNFIIKSKAELASSTYELTYSEEKGSKISLNNNIYHEVDENILPTAQSMQIVPDNGAVNSAVYLRANISDNNQLGSCIFSITGPQSFNSESTSCKASFIPATEGIYYINVTPKDYYSNLGNSISKQYSANILPAPLSASIDKSIPFYHASDSIVINASFKVALADSLGTCEIIARNESAEASLGTFSASGSDCYGTVPLTNLDGEYMIFAKVTETTENNIVESNSTALFVCSGISGLCRYSDFNADSKPDFCPDSVPANITIVYPAQNAQLAAGTTSITVNISTNENAICRYSTLSTFNFSQGTLFANTGGLSHTFVSFGSNIGGTYHYYYKCNDTSGNVNPSSTEHVFSILSSPAPPGGGGGGGIGSPCIDDSNCIKGYICENGKCMKAKCESDKECPPGHACYKKRDCRIIKEEKPAPAIMPLQLINSVIEFIKMNAEIIETIIAIIAVMVIISALVLKILNIELGKELANFWIYARMQFKRR